MLQWYRMIAIINSDILAITTMLQWYRMIAGINSDTLGTSTPITLKGTTDYKTSVCELFTMLCGFTVPSTFPLSLLLSPVNNNKRDGQI
jgi:hypothetical protein